MNVDPTSPNFCPAFQEALQAYLDGTASALPAECGAHQVACPSCRQDYAAAMLVRAFRRSLDPAPEGMTDRLVAAVVADSVVAERRRRMTQAAAAILALAAGFLLAIGIVNRFT